METTLDIDSGTLSAPETARIAATLDNWKRKLLDVSKRNRALSFKPNKVTTITVVDEQPGEVFRQLYLQDRKMRFRPAVPKQGAFPLAGDATETAESGEDEEEASALSLDFAPYVATDLGDHHTDDFLQTATTAENLDKSLRRIAEQARVSIEEQGVNTLFLTLGMLHFREAAASDEVFRAPLVLLPVELCRTSARAGYTLQATDDDPIVNPALVEYLARAHGVVMPCLPDLIDLPETYDLQRFFIEVTEAVSTQSGWQVKTDIFLSFFSFQKFLMYKDMEANSAAFSSHPLIKQLILRSGSSLRALPDEVRQTNLDEVFAPESTAQITNADSSQLRAILAVSRNHNLVLEGPPGTGKSQTITNLIAQALSENKSVLFVAEKIAALEVVYNRLVEAGLGEFCLELHSTKANKRAVMQELAATLDASLQRPRTDSSATGRIATVRAELTAYADALHLPHGALGMSPFEAYGELERVLEARKLKFTKPIDDVTREQLNEVERDLRDLAEAAQSIGIPSRHPWRDTTRTFYSEQDLDAAGEVLRSLGSRIARITELAVRVENEFSLPTIRSFADVSTASAVAGVMARSPGAPLAVLQSEAWNSPPRQALEMVERGRALRQLRESVEGRFLPMVLEQDHSPDIAFVETKENSPLRLFNFLSGKFRALKARWLGYRLPSYQATLLEQAAEMRQVDRLRQERAALAAQDSQGQQLFGALWQGEHSDWSALDGYIRWVTEFRGVCVANGLKEQALAVASRPHPDISVIEQLRGETDEAEREMTTLRSHVGWTPDYLAASPVAEVRQRIERMLESINLAPRWAAFELSRARVAKGLGVELLEPATNGEVPFDDLAKGFRRAFLQRWLSGVVQGREPLRDFATPTHEKRVEEFRRLDEGVLLENRANLVRSLRERVQKQLQTPEAVGGLPFLRTQLTRQRGLSPLRTTFQKSHAAIRAIKPIYMMSPLSVAQLLDGKQPAFDLVIFDEASQLPAEDAVGAIVRGRQLVVVGDPKQLPPTNFFSVMSGTVTAQLGEDGTPLFEDSESILEEFMGAGAPSTRLKWHYRSAHESLINFSNVSFYESDLYTFPSVETNSHDAGLSFEYVPEGVYEGKGLNLVEARRVADAVVRHAKTNPDATLGVGTFNLRQQIAIQDELEVRRRQDPSLEPFFARNKREPFFVKNLENIQGDERDVIFLSVTYAKDANGVLRYNFGPLNGENGWRRLNVLTTRARKSMRVFSSMKGDEINPVHATSQGPQLLRDFLLYAERGFLNSTVASAAAETESPFEREVYTELTRHAVKLQPQVGVAGYRIDFGVFDDALPGRYLCGIECDGAAYHSSETARDRDRLRQQVLEARGWTIHRLWSTDWFKDRQGQVERLLALIEKTRDKTHEEQTAEEEARARLAALEQEERAENGTLLHKSAEPPLMQPLVPAEVYEFAATPMLYAGQDFNTAPTSFIDKAISDVVRVESPLHFADLAARVVARWDYDRVGPKMMRLIKAVTEEKQRRGEAEIRGDFIFAAGSEIGVRVRSRADTKIPPERIAPEEYGEAVLTVLRAGDGVDRATLINKVRALFGFGQSGQTLKGLIGAAIEGLIAEQVIGEGGAGIKLRQSA